MDLSREVDGYIKETIDESLGLPISTDALQRKLYAAEESHRRLREQYLSLVSRLKERDQVIELARSEASMNAQALKKSIGENQKLAGECDDLVIHCKKLEKECLLYHQDRESLMDFGNETDERAREAESRVRELEQQVREMSDEIESKEDCLVDSVLGSFVISRDESISSGHLFLEANREDEFYQALLSKWDELKPSTQKVLSLVSVVKRIEKEKECLILNLAKAEQEVELVSEQNRELDRENRRFLRQCSVERSSHGSNKFNKRKSPKLMNSPIEKRIELSSQDFP
ncbi:hypothetical protein CARUB_v10009927mg [Capsella rubella]|uniref:Uncharacterized protein n=1 Tax=Capsella rubella TaxID=81985 RepID=R0GM11_9BRAS|nr:golgin subfamily A member 6-like protein 1 [Capsella rubella]EOA36967.1 hypothetical protein CARUB_v10009927mg [Capsella rubella]